MTPFFVADVGNTAIKCGRATRDRLEDCCTLDTNSTSSWVQAIQLLRVPAGSSWHVAGVHPIAVKSFSEFVRVSGSNAEVISDFKRIPISMDVDHPDKVGIDRLLAAVGAIGQLGGGKSIAVVGVGTAVTVDLVDHRGVFRGGAILPGLRLMARALNEFTAQLPLIEDFSLSDAPGRDTSAAIQAGIVNAVAGGIDRIVDQYRQVDAGIRVMIFGGDAEALPTLRCQPIRVGQYLPLDGLRLCVVHLHG